MQPTDPHTLAIEVRDVSKRFAGVAALDCVHLTARRGEVHALLGENGAGKSTLIKILVGAVRPDSGTVIINGAPLSTFNPQESAHAGIAAVFQELSLIPDLSVAENVWFRKEPRTVLRTVSRRRLRRMTEELFERIGLEGIDPTQSIRGMAIGERQFVEVAKAVAMDPRVLILDEATSALSPREAKWLTALARSFAAQQRTVIFISHRLGEVREVADTITVLRNGKNVGTRGTSELSADEIVSMMLGREASRLYPERQSTASETVALRTIGLQFGHRLRGVDLALHEGEVLGIGGLQGQGQSELFLRLVGVVRGGGDIEVGGLARTIRSPRDALRCGLGIAFVPEDRREQGLLLSKSLRENVTLAITGMFARFGVLDLGQERRIVADAIARFNIKASDMEGHVGTLSGGNQQKVVIAKLLLTEAKILLLYDLTRGVDVGTKAEIFRLMRDLAARGYALLFFSTDNEELLHVCDRVAVMNRGRVRAILQGERLREEEIVRFAIGAEDQ